MVGFLLMCRVREIIYGTLDRESITLHKQSMKGVVG